MSLTVVPHDQQDKYKFGPWTIDSSEVFVRTPLSYAFVNLKPLVPGHVLVSPLRPARRFPDLTPDEVSDLMVLAQRVAATLERHFGAAATTLAVQDGEAAGQTVPHVHVHILPRRPGDFDRNDQVYDEIEGVERSMGGDMERSMGEDMERRAVASGAAADRGVAAAAAAAAGPGSAADHPAPAERLNLDVERKPRTREEMAREASELRALFS